MSTSSSFSHFYSYFRLSCSRIHSFFGSVIPLLMVFYLCSLRTGCINKNLHFPNARIGWLQNFFVLISKNLLLRFHKVPLREPSRTEQEKQTRTRIKKREKEWKKEWETVYRMKWNVKMESILFVRKNDDNMRPLTLQKLVNADIWKMVKIIIIFNDQLELNKFGLFVVWFWTIIIIICYFVPVISLQLLASIWTIHFGKR